MCRPVSTSIFLGAIISSVLILSVTSQRAKAEEIVTINFQSQALNLDNGVVSDGADEPTAEPTGADVLFAYNADREPHAVVWQAEKGVEIAFVDNVSFDGVSAADLDNLSFTDEPLDLPLEAGDTVVVRTDTGAVYKLGNAVESAATVTINYERIQ